MKKLSDTDVITAIIQCLSGNESIEDLEDLVEVALGSADNPRDLSKVNNSTTFNNYPASASNNAKKVLRWKEEHGDEVKAMTQVGWARAHQLANKEPISYQIVKKMASFNRHRKNAEIDPKYKSEPWKDNGYVAWLGWGGTSGVNWALAKVEAVKNAKKRVKASHEDDDDIIEDVEDDTPKFIPNEGGPIEDQIRAFLAYYDIDFKERKTYSGRGMYGRVSPFAFVTYINPRSETGIRLRDEFGLSVDNMGLDYIYYLL